MSGEGWIDCSRRLCDVDDRILKRLQLYDGHALVREGTMRLVRQEGRQITWLQLEVLPHF